MLSIFYKNVTNIERYMGSVMGVECVLCCLVGGDYRGGSP